MTPGRICHATRCPTNRFIRRAHSGNSGALLALIDRCRTRLQEKAFLLGTRIYAEKPRDFAGRFGHYWKGWTKAAVR